jgi:DNA-binding MarR family transcriptional regulator
VQERDHVQHVLGQWQQEAPRLDRSAFAVIGRISRLARLLEDEHEPVFAGHDLSAGEFDVLAALRRSGKPYRLTPTALCAALMVSTGGMTKRLNALEGRGLVEREPDPNDGRSLAVTLTREGRRLVDDAVEAHAANQERLLRGLDKKELRELSALLEKLALSLGDVAQRPTRSSASRRARGSRTAAANVSSSTRS